VEAAPPGGQRRRRGAWHQGSSWVDQRRKGKVTPSSCDVLLGARWGACGRGVVWGGCCPDGGEHPDSGGNQRLLSSTAWVTLAP